MWELRVSDDVAIIDADNLMMAYNTQDEYTRPTIPIE
jgi:hypothetical protein